MAAEELCLRCGGANLVAAHVERPMAFCMGHAAHHGVLHLGLKASLCPACGHVEFSMPDPAQILGPQEAEADTIIQEEDF